jgi:hypothetical protein
MLGEKVEEKRKKRKEKILEEKIRSCQKNKEKSTGRR